MFITVLTEYGVKPAGLWREDDSLTACAVPSHFPAFEANAGVKQNRSANPFAL
jgi:hypothetical protein